MFVKSILRKMTLFFVSDSMVTRTLRSEVGCRSLHEIALSYLHMSENVWTSSKSNSVDKRFDVHVTIILKNLILTA